VVQEPRVTADKSGQADEVGYGLHYVPAEVGLEGCPPVVGRVSGLLLLVLSEFSLGTYQTPTHQLIKPANPPCATRCAPF
jgi:hypothetical protein